LLIDRLGDDNARAVFNVDHVPRACNHHRWLTVSLRVFLSLRVASLRNGALSGPGHYQNFNFDSFEKQFRIANSRDYRQ
jgi:hypothetical protein